MEKVQCILNYLGKKEEVSGNSPLVSLERIDDQFFGRLALHAAGATGRMTRLDATEIEERIEGFGQRPQGFLIHGVVHPAGVQRVPLHLHQACIAQYPQMVGDEVFGHTQSVTKLAIALYTRHQQIQDAQALGIGQHLKLCGKGFGRWLNFWSSHEKMKRRDSSNDVEVYEV